MEPDTRQHATNTPQQADPIAAIATPVGVGALAVVRVSGLGAHAIGDRVFRKPGGTAMGVLSASPGFHAHFGCLYDGDALVDEVVALVCRAPRSFTAEDMVEFTCHGGPVVVTKVLQLLLDNGCRLAEPGEFTRRAFLNGRIDLLQAEAIGEMIHARSESAYRTAVSQMQGDLSRKLDGLREQLLRSCALLELELDFSEEDVEFQSRHELLAQVDDLYREVARLADSFRHGRLLREGVATVIAGRPNAGKSTLLNALLGQERAIVSQMPGTTRDYIEEGFVHDNVLFRLIDTAGLRETGAEVEHEGIRRSRVKMAEADLILYLVDLGSEQLDEEAADIRRIHASHPSARLIAVASKTDRVPDPEERIAAVAAASGVDTVGISVLGGRGVGELLQRMGAIARELDKLHEASVLVTSLRHYEALRNAAAALANARRLIDGYAETELIAFELRSALASVGEITGKVVNEEILNTIFSRFCIGK